MGFFDKLKGELIDIIEWIDDSNDTMVYRFDRYNNEIKNGAKLTVRESQVAVFISEGKIADVFSPGMHTLSTENLPVLSTLKGWKFGFNSPFKAEVYFISTRNFTDLKWGTKNPIMLRDPEFGPVRLRAFGSYTMKVTDGAKFIKEVTGTDGEFTTSEISDQLRNLVITRFTDALGESKIPMLDLASQYDELSDFCKGKLSPEFLEYGIDITKFLVENISLPKEVEEALDKRSSMGILGNMNQYTQFQAANAMEAAANNSEGGMGAGMGMGMGAGMGMGMAGQMAGAMNQQQAAPQQQQAGSVPPPPPMPSSYHIAVNGQQQGPFTMPQLQQMVAQGTFTKETHVWKEGMAGWETAGNVAEVSGLFGGPAVPPPPPM